MKQVSVQTCQAPEIQQEEEEEVVFCFLFYVAYCKYIKSRKFSKCTVVTSA